MAKEENKQDLTGRNVPLSERFLIWFIPVIIVWTQRIYGLTLRRFNTGDEPLKALRREGSPWIYAIWHTNVFFSPYFNRNQKVNVLVSASRDGELITGVVTRFGNRTIRGSTSKGGIRALKELIKAVRRGEPAAITPDGPRGPRFVLQEGIILAAQRCGVPIIPFHYEATRQWVFEKAWDRHRIPKPFSRVVVSYGDPIEIPASMDVQEFEAMVRLVQERLLENVRTCQNRVRELKGEPPLTPQDPLL